MYIFRQDWPYLLLFADVKLAVPSIHFHIVLFLSFCDWTAPLHSLIEVVNIEDTLLTHEGEAGPLHNLQGECMGRLVSGSLEVPTVF